MAKVLRALVCGGQVLFDYSANPHRLCVVLGPRGSDLEALSEISRGAGPGEEQSGTWAHQLVNSGQTGEGLFGGPLLAQRLVRAPSLSPRGEMQGQKGHHLRQRARVRTDRTERRPLLSYNFSSPSRSDVYPLLGSLPHLVKYKQYFPGRVFS